MIYWTNEGLVSVSVETNTGFVPGIPKVLFPTKDYVYVRLRNYDIAPDGQHFVMVKRLDSHDPETVVVLNWFGELERQLPSR